MAPLRQEPLKPPLLRWRVFGDSSPKVEFQPTRLRAAKPPEQAPGWPREDPKQIVGKSDNGVHTGNLAQRAARSHIACKNTDSLFTLRGARAIVVTVGYRCDSVVSHHRAASQLSGETSSSEALGAFMMTTATDPLARAYFSNDSIDVTTAQRTARRRR